MATKRVTVKDIANQLNISVGTVSKALSGKPGISADMRDKIFRTSEAMGYNVNRLAQSLARKPIRIAIVYPLAWEQYYGDIIQGMNDALESLRDYNVTGEFIQFTSLYSTDELFQISDELIQKEADAVILCPASVTACKPCLQKLKAHNIPVFLVGNDFDPEDRAGCVRVNAQMAGRLASEILCYITPAESNLVIFIGDLSILEHREKVEGFKSELLKGHYLLQTYETHDEPEVAALLTKKALREIPNIQGIYIATGNSLTICDVLKNEKVDHKIKVIATDLYDTMIPYIQDRTINAIIYQHPGEQGRKAVMQCYRYIIDRSIDTSQVLINPRAVFRSNL